jgi:hypothetical protein
MALIVDTQMLEEICKDNDTIFFLLVLVLVVTMSVGITTLEGEQARLEYHQPAAAIRAVQNTSAFFVRPFTTARRDPARRPCCRRRTGEAVTSSSSKLPAVDLDPDLLKEAMLVLTRNAKDAMPTGAPSPRRRAVEVKMLDVGPEHVVRTRFASRRQRSLCRRPSSTRPIAL